MASGKQVKSAFRALLRTRKRCFEGDQAMLAASAKQIRDEFEAHRQSSDPSEIQGLLVKARDTAEFMTLNLVQAKLNERGNYEVKLRKEHAGVTLAPAAEKSCKSAST